MARSSRTPARLVVALAVAAMLAVFLVNTAVSGTTPALQPSNLAGHAGTVSLTGKVMGPVMGDSHRPHAGRSVRRDRPDDEVPQQVHEELSARRG